LWEEPEGFVASRILDEGYDEMTDLRPVGARPGFNNGWPRLPVNPGVPGLALESLNDQQKRPISQMGLFKKLPD